MKAWSRALPLIFAFALGFVCLGSAVASGQQPAATPTPTPAVTPTPTPNLDVRMIRLKISAGDLPSAESILEVHRAELGEDADYLLGLAWVARGAVLLHDWKAASAHAKAAREIAESKLQTAADYETNREAVYALGTAIEVQAQVLEASGRKSEAIRFLEDSSRAQEKAPYNLRARIWKRRNQIELVGQKAPAIAAEAQLEKPPPSLESLKGTPVVLYFWWEACGDCKTQAAAFRRTVAKYSSRGVAFLAPTRFYGTTAERGEEKARIEKAWKELYALSDSVPVPISDAAMLRYGVSATPSFAFVDRKGVVTRYSPTRMTEERLSAAIEDLLR